MNHYINEEGNTVFTSEYHRKKGSCCHSNCLHCPFGTTLKNIGVKITEINQDNQADGQALFDDLYGGSDDITASLLAGAFGGQKQEFDPSSFVILSLKSVVCGMAQKKADRYENIRLKPHFTEQGITESYLNSLE